MVACHSGVISEEGLVDWLDGNLVWNDGLGLSREGESDVDVVGGSNDLNVALTMKKEKEGNKGEEDVTAPKRGFISFASQYGTDDYALSSY